jgi:homeobox-leucine zipper protein
MAFSSGFINARVLNFCRTKLKQTEVDCEFLKRCCENLTEENRRLQKEVQELRALKLSPQFYMQMTPPTTLTMCPSCERVAAPPHRIIHR